MDINVFTREKYKMDREWRMENGEGEVGQEGMNNRCCMEMKVKLKS